VNGRPAEATPDDAPAVASIPKTLAVGNTWRRFSRCGWDM